MRLEINGTGLDVEASGDVGGEGVLLVHGWPDTHDVWRHQVEALTAAGYRTVCPDLRGFGESDKPEWIGDYGMLKHLGDLIGILEHFDLERVHVVGHDWGGAIGAVLASMVPERVASLTCLSVGHPAAFARAGWTQREKSWYMLLFQFPGVAECWLSRDDFGSFRDWSRHPEADTVVERLRDPAALTASLGVYRAILPPETLLAPPSPLPPIQAPTMGIWSSEDPAVTEAAMTGTVDHLVGPWRYERLAGIGHWLQLEAPDRVNDLLIEFFAVHPAPSVELTR
jgi:pimeloyl-ACP methyl ester carboxylesterase